LSCLDPSLPVFDYCFVIDRPSHVRLHQPFGLKPIFGNQVLIDATSIAIWNRNKVVATVAIIVWGIIFGTHLHSKFLLLIPAKDLGSPYKRGLVTDIAVVNSQFR